MPDEHLNHNLMKHLSLMKLKKLLSKTCITYAISLFPVLLHAQKDVVPPVITYSNPADTVCIQIGSVWIMQYAVTDNQSDKNSITVSINWGMNGPVNTLQRRMYPVEIEATDSNGNKSKLKLNLRVDDCIAPVIHLNTPDTICVKWRTPYYPVQPTVTDNYYSGGQVSLVRKSSDVNPNIIGIYTEVYEAVDGSGNITTRIRIVRVAADCDATVGVSDIPGLQFSIYPQPANDILNVQVAGDFNGSDLSVWSLEGVLLYQANVSQSVESIDVAKWPCGIYLLRVGNGEFSRTRTFILQR